MNSTVQTLASKMEDSENVQNKNRETRVQPFRKLVQAATGKRQLMLRNKNQGQRVQQEKKIELRLRIRKAMNQINS